MICRLICKQHVCIGGTFDKCYTIFKEQIYFDNMFILCYTICKKINSCYCSPRHISFQKSHNNNMLFFCLQYAWTHVIFRHGIQFHSVQWDHRSSMVRYHDHVSTASSQRDVVQDTCRTRHLYVPSGSTMEAQG